MYKLPKWVKSIPKSTGHGSGDLQQRLWRLCSDYVRLRDFYTYRKCVATGQYIQDWRDTDAGHFIPYSTCNGMFKFDIWNIHAQSKKSNAWGGMSDGYYFGEELKRRYGEDFLEELKTENRSHISEKVENCKIVDEMIAILDLFESLPEKPDYYERVQKLRYEERTGK